MNKLKTVRDIVSFAIVKDGSNSKVIETCKRFAAFTICLDNPVTYTTARSRCSGVDDECRHDMADYANFIHGKNCSKVIEASKKALGHYVFAFIDCEPDPELLLLFEEMKKAGRACHLMSRYNLFTDAAQIWSCENGVYEVINIDSNGNEVESAANMAENSNPSPPSGVKTAKKAKSKKKPVFLASEAIEE